MYTKDLNTNQTRNPRKNNNPYSNNDTFTGVFFYLKPHFTVTIPKI